jgi:hypothetical protein
MTNRIIRLTLTCAFLAAPSCLAGDGDLAGPIWGEGPESTGAGGSKDAGSTPDTSQPVSSPLAPSTGSTLTSIRGGISPTSLLAPDRVDMYEISITSNTNWTISAASTTQFNPAIFLFRKVINSSGEATALPVAMCDDANSSTVLPSLIGSCGGTVPNPNAVCLAAGIYYLAVAPSGAVPYRCANDPILQTLFTYTPGQDGAVLPTTAQQGDLLCDWGVPTTAAGGDYTLTFSGNIVVSRATTPETTVTLGTGLYSYGNPGTTTDTEDRRIGLNDCGFVPWMANPTWFRLADCRGTTTIKACSTNASANPLAIVVFQGVPGSLTPIACSTQGTSCSATGAEVTFTNLDTEPIFVAYGPMTLTIGSSTVTSAGTLEITCVPTSPSADINQDGVIDGTDLALLLSQWGS